MAVCEAENNNGCNNEETKNSFQTEYIPSGLYKYSSSNFRSRSHDTLFAFLRYIHCLVPPFFCFNYSMLEKQRWVFQPRSLGEPTLSCSHRAQPGAKIHLFPPMFLLLPPSSTPKIYRQTMLRLAILLQNKHKLLPFSKNITTAPS